MIKLSLRHFHLIFKQLPFLVIILIVVSCQQKQSENRDHLVFRYNEHANITSLDPAFAKDQRNIWAVHQLFNGLVEMDNELNVIPAIAKSWNVSEDALTYTFTLRDDVQFHKHELFGKDSTRIVTAHDFEYSFGRILDDKLASSGRWIFKSVQNFKAIDKTTFQIQLKQPFPAFLSLLTMKYCSVVPKEIVEHYGNDFRANPIGTGPFQFKIWEENTKLVLRRNPNYFEKDDKGNKLPYLEAVAITFLPDKQSEFLQFVQGNIDFLNSLDPSYQDEILNAAGQLRKKYTTDINLISGPYLNTEYLGIYIGDSSNVSSHHLLRKAMNYSFDRKKMITYLRSGIGTPAIHGFIPKGLPGFDNIEGFTYQPERAKELVKNYIKETGNSNPEVSITTNGQYLNFCEYIQRELEKIDIKASVNVIPASTLRELRSKGELPIFRASWIADYPDAENYLSLFYSKNFTPNGPNYTHFKNAQFDTWYETALRETNALNRAKLYTKMDSLLISEAPLIPLYYDQVVRFTQNNVQGLGINALNLLELKRVRKE
ncbi:peptide/nickel transport system substrate-binding protein [Kordia periserrulae]|uniref:Peptide/nickel transport system substrate-binding protein n=1 Tax=Kordia periserrulae TaxID=701523 RepID=A0A2T6C3N1_9FLAO|nr:ABC transporter substrate-binding protein [Kordia periserrulae]PTX62867.1 peptide/nickel transport system substrate-binding protein [Kordia periserrulae]